MGFDKHRREDVFAKPPRVFHDTSSDEEVEPYWIAIDATDTSASSYSYTLLEDVRVIDAYAIPTSTTTSATVKITDADDNDITDALDIATDKTVARVSTIDDANWEEDEGNVIKAVENSTADTAHVYVKVIPVQ